MRSSIIKSPTGDDFCGSRSRTRTSSGGDPRMSLVLHSGILEVYFEPRRSILSTTVKTPFWAAHQFLLEGKKLIYLGQDGKVGRSIELNHMCKAKDTALNKDQLGRNFIFMVSLGFVGPGNKLILNAKDDAEREHWITVINAVCNNKPVAENLANARKSVSRLSISAAADESLSPVGKSSSQSQAATPVAPAPSTPVVSEKKKSVKAVESVKSDEDKSVPKCQGVGMMGYTVLSALSLLGALVLQNQFEGVEAYMDEVFHIPQAQRYCEGKFYPDGWDSKITTFPGVYYLSYLLKTGWELAVKVGREALTLANQEKEEPSSYWLYDSTPAPSATLGFDLCSTQALRAQSVVLGCLIFLASFRARGALVAAREGQGEGKGASVATALVVTLYPVSAFYFFLFYTDTASTLFLVLAVWVASAAPAGGLAKLVNLVLSVGAGAAAIAMRQTNAIWVAFIAGAALIPSESRGSIGAYLQNVFRGGATFSHIKAAALLVPVGAFAHFVVNMNEGSIVLGDKVNHVPALHWAMPIHALAVLSVTLILIKPPPASSGGKTAINAPSTLRVAKHAFGIAGVSAALYYGSLDHPFLLSDNRHYTFYLWQRFLSDEKARLALGPVYYFLIQKGLCALTKANGMMWVLGFLAAAALTLVPAPLLEPRYFTPTIIIGLLGAPHATTEGTSNTLRLCVAAALFLLVNAATIHVFSSMPFKGASGEVARFMY